jgi:glycosyltransferase involved in cell wall biosynthesis
MRILYITPNNPYVTYSGGHQRSNLLLKALVNFADVDVFAFSDNDHFFNISDTIIPRSKLVSSIETIPDNRPIFCKLFSKIKDIIYFRSNRALGKKNKVLVKELKNILVNKYDYIVVRYLTTVVQCGLKFDKKVIIDLDDLPENLYRSMMQFPRKSKIELILQRYYYFLLSHIARRRTDRLIQNVFHLFIVNKNEMKFDNSSYLPNIPYPIDIENQENLGLSKKSNIILFVGKLSYMLNIIGIDHFLKFIWPSVLGQKPSTIFRIVGLGLSDEIRMRWEKNNNVEVVGFVPDISLQYQEATIVIVPIYVGGGTNIKVLEAMSMGKACVITKFASKGFENFLKNGINIIIAENDQSFIDGIVSLLEDNIFLSKVEKESRFSISKEYSFEYFSGVVEKIFK